MVAASPYATAVALGGQPPNYVNTKMEDDRNRVQSYFAYSDVYTNVDTAFSALLRDDEDTLSRRYIPLARTIVEGTASYLGKDLGWTWVMSDTGAPAEDPVRLEAQAAIDSLFRREEFLTKFAGVKRWGLIRGDSMLHVTADPLKPEGTRIRITELDPAQYFAITDPVDDERVIGCYVVSIVLADDGTTEIAQRLMYRRIMNEDDASVFGSPVGTVVMQMGFFAVDKWDDRYPLSEDDLTPADVPERLDTPSTQLLANPTALPAQIGAIPVYHFRNRRGGGSGVFGVSELQGVETILAGATGTVSDEDLAVALQGLGFYATDSGHPVDAQGAEVDWVVAPGSIAEVQDGKRMWRVEGATNIEAPLGHFAALRNSALETTGTPDVAVGKVDVQVAESGIALAIQFAPMTSKNAEKETELKAKLDQLMHDLLHGWLPAYEALSPDERLEAHSTFGPPLPVNRKETVEMVLNLVKENLVSKQWALDYLSKTFGLTFPDNMLQDILDEQAAALDAMGPRLTGEAAPAPVA